MWWRNSLCTSADEGLGTLAEYDPLTFPRGIPGVSGGLFWWHGHGISRFAATTAATSNALGTCRQRLPSAPTRFWRRLCPPRDKTGQPAGGTGGQTWNSRHSAWRVGRSRAPFTVLAELSRWLEGSQGLRGPWAPSPKLPICHQQGTSTQACLMDQSVAWALVPKATWERLSEKRWLLSCNVGSASPTLVARCRHPPASSMEELEKIGLSNDGSRLGAAQLERLKLTRESNSSQVIRAHECELQRDLGVMPGEPWSYHRHARDKVLQAASRMFASRWPRVTEWSLQPLTGLHGPGVRRTLSHAPPPDSDASVQTSSGSSCAQLMTAKLQDAASKSNSSNTRQGKRSHDILCNSLRGWQKWASKNVMQKSGVVQKIATLDVRRLRCRTG